MEHGYREHRQHGTHQFPCAYYNAKTDIKKAPPQAANLGRRLINEKCSPRYHPHSRRKKQRALNIAFNGATRFCLIEKIFQQNRSRVNFEKNFIRGKTFSPMVFPLFSEK